MASQVFHDFTAMTIARPASDAVTALAR